VGVGLSLLVVRKALLIGCCAFLLLSIVLGALAWWAPLPRAAGPTLLRTESSEPMERRLVRHVLLEDASLGSISLSLSLPHPLPERPLPVVFVLGGLQTGQASIAHVREPGDNILVGYDWPIPRQLPSGAELAWKLPALRRSALIVPGQVSVALRWVAAQPWADGERISLLGFSLGAIAAPAVQRLTATEGVHIGWTVLGYGGTDLGLLVSEHPQVQRARWGAALGPLTGLLLRPIEPAEHLPHLAGRFLVIAGRNDSLISERAAARLRALTPEPKTVVLLEGDHLGVGRGQQKLLERLIAEARSWLDAEGAVNPP
jgi:hypothetical protein